MIYFRYLEDKVEKNNGVPSEANLKHDMTYKTILVHTNRTKCLFSPIFMYIGTFDVYDIVTCIINILFTLHND